jgi:hypothetical protein
MVSGNLFETIRMKWLALSLEDDLLLSLSTRLRVMTNPRSPRDQT